MKYCVTHAAGTRYLLRVSPASRYEHRKALYEILHEVAATGIPMNQPIGFWESGEGVCMLFSWIGGEDLTEGALSHLPAAEQYAFGQRAGEILRKIHTVPAPSGQEDWEPRFNRKIDMKIRKYHECGLRFEGDRHVLAYIEQNRRLLKGRPQCFQHGDYHANNIMIENGELRIIDFDRYDFGDPWEEFNRIVISAQDSPYFALGQMRGYFNGDPPMEFFRLLALYIAVNTLSNITWAKPFGQSQLDFMMQLNKDILRWYDNMRNPVPGWYLKGEMT